MSRPKSFRRCPLAALEKAWKDSGVDPDLVALGVHVVRRVRADTPGVDVFVRMAQDLGLRTWFKVVTDGGNLLTLNRALGEFTRTLRVLGVRVPGRSDGRSRVRGSGFTPPQLPTAQEPKETNNDF